MNRLNVKATKTPFVLLGLLGLIFIPLGLGSFIVSVLDGFRFLGLILGFSMLAMLGFIVWIVLRGHSKSVKYFTDLGLLRNDGRRCNWVNLRRVVNQIKYDYGRNTEWLWRVEIQFKDGSAAWLIPSKVSNFQEAYNFVRNLPCEQAEEYV